MVGRLHFGSDIALTAAGTPLPCSRQATPANIPISLSPPEKHVSAADFGTVPELNATNAASEPLVGPGGRIHPGKLIKTVQFIAHTKKNLRCEVKAGENILIDDSRADFLLVNPDTPCTVEGSGFTEWYVTRFAPAIVISKTSETRSASTSDSTSNKAPPVHYDSKQSALENTNLYDTSSNTTTGALSSIKKVSGNDSFGCTAVAQTVIQESKTRVDHKRNWNYVIFDVIDESGCWNPSKLTRLSKVLTGGIKPGPYAIPGNLFPRGGVKQDGHESGFITKGQAHSFRIEISFNKKELNAASFMAAPYKTLDKRSLSPMNQIPSASNTYPSGSAPEKLVMNALDGNEDVARNACEHKFRVVSPIVLNLANLGFFDRTTAAESNVRFDFLHNGDRPQADWLKPTIGLLAIDHISHIKADHDGELFGEATRLEDGRPARNGYQALASLDSNRDGAINHSDKLLGWLMAWVDAISDGLSHSSELHTRYSLGFTRLSVEYSPSLRHGAPFPFSNDVLVKSRYWAPKKSGTEGCMSSAVFFSTVVYVSKQQR